MFRYLLHKPIAYVDQSLNTHTVRCHLETWGAIVDRGVKMYLTDFSKNMDLIKDKNSFQGHLVAFYRFSKFLRVGSSARIFEKMFFWIFYFYADQSKTTLMNFSNQIFFIFSFIPMGQNLMIPMCPLSVHVRCRPPWIVKCLKIWICRFTP